MLTNWISLYPTTQACGFDTHVGMIDSCGSFGTFVQIDPRWELIGHGDRHDSVELLR